MDKMYEIFRNLPAGPIWVRSVTGLILTQETVVTLNKIHPGQYFAYDIYEARIVAGVFGEPKPELITDTSRQQMAMGKKAAHG